MGGLANKKIYNKWNSVRNDLKHHDKRTASTVRLNLFDEAYWMIRRASANSCKAGVEIPNAADFETWRSLYWHQTCCIDARAV
ncbi:hypothetical protein SAMN05216345_1336 [Cupriavidus sp. YR651]|nr:hypothetical protein SAMN05216345_1336 [Cupriavidus sp. YR651]